MSGPFGAQALTDQNRGYASFIAIEGTAALGAELLTDAKPPLDDAQKAAE